MRKVSKTFKGGGQKVAKKIDKRAKKIHSLESTQRKIIINANKVQTKLNKKASKKAANKASGKTKSFLSKAISRLFGTSTKNLTKKQKSLRKKFNATSNTINEKRTKQAEALEIEKKESIKITGTANATLKSQVSKKSEDAEAQQASQIASAITGQPKPPVADPLKPEADPLKPVVGGPTTPVVGGPTTPVVGGPLKPVVGNQSQTKQNSASTMTVGTKTYNLSEANKKLIDNAQTKLNVLSSSEPSILSDPGHQAKIAAASAELVKITQTISKSFTNANIVVPKETTTTSGSTSVSTSGSTSGTTSGSTSGSTSASTSGSTSASTSGSTSG